MGVMDRSRRMFRSVAATKIPAILLLFVLLAGCYHEETEVVDGGPSDSDTGQDMDAMGDMGSTTRILAEGRLDELPPDALAWIGYEVPAGERTDPGTADEHGALGPGFVYAMQGAHRVGVNGEEIALATGEGAFAHTITLSPEPEGGLLIVLLADPQAEPPEALRDARRLFASDALQGIPAAPVNVIFASVDLEPGGMTVRHTHPGPEFIVVTAGEITYEAADREGEPLGPEDARTLPSDTPVRKRNPGDEVAAFLSFFIVDPARPWVEPMDAGGMDDGMADG